MDELDLQLDDVVLFELPSAEDATAFRLRLRSRWPGWSAEDEDVWLFAAELGDAPENLPRLLREAQGLLGERGLAPIRFVLDGRIYALGSAA
jgi:hypothetical protein